MSRLRAWSEYDAETGTKVHPWGLGQARTCKNTIDSWTLGISVKEMELSAGLIAQPTSAIVAREARRK